MQIVNLQIAPTSVKPVVHMSQSDVGRQFQLRLFDGAVAYSLPSGTTARIDGIKPDREGFSYSDAVSVSGNTITVTTKTQMTTTPGNVECEIRLVNNNEDIGTLNFIMIVEESPLSNVDISKTDLPVIIAEVKEAAEAAVTSAEIASSSASSASTSASSAESSATDAEENGLKAEGYAVGKQNGADVPSGSDYYHNNAEYYAEIARSLSANPPYIGANGHWYVWNTSTNQYVDSGIDASITVDIADITMLAPNATPYVTNTGTDTDPVFHLFIPRGTGISSVTKTGTSGLVDTYTITYTDNTTTTFTVTNGADGQNGQDGATGNGIASITKTSTSGLVDTYTILYTDGTSTTFTVTNGQNGTGAGDMLAADYDPTQAVYNEGGIAAYVAAQLSGFSTSLSGLSDVALASLATGQSLVYDATSGKWVNGSVSYSNLTNKPTLGTAAAKNSTNAVTPNSTDLVESGAVSAEIQTLTKYANAQSNPNLLDNPWFTVNQRGFTSDSNPSAGTHIADRWAVRYNPSSGEVAVNDGIVTLTSTGGLLIIAERFEESVAFSGKRMTASIMLSDGTIYSDTAVFPSKNGADVHVIDTDDFTVYFQYSSYSENYPMLAITCKANKTLAIKAVKLELGEVSTLAMDTAPNYATELLKCQRYFFRVNQKVAVTAILGFGYNISTTDSRINIPIPIEMRTSPTIIASDLSKVWVVSGGTSQHPSAIGYANTAGASMTLYFTVAGMTINEMAYLSINSITDYIDISADL